MKIDTEDIFRYKIPSHQRLTAYGFYETDKGYSFKKSIMNGQFELSVLVGTDASVSYTVLDSEFGGEYALVNVDAATSGFVAEVQAACENILADIAKSCFDTQALKAEQTKRLLENILTKYAVQPEFLWDGYPDCAAFRRTDNRKWFAVIMSVERSKLGLSGKGSVEILDMKADPDTVALLLKQKNFYPAYHMNKKHWYTVCLDGSITDESLFSLLDTSYRCVEKKTKKRL